MRKLAAILTVLLIHAAPLSTAAQSLPLPGDRVRLETRSGGELRGDVVNALGAAIRLRTEDGSEEVVPWERVEAMEMSTGSGSFIRPFAISLGAGAVVGAVWFLLVEAACDSWCFNDSGDAFLVGAAAGAVTLGLPIGTVAGLINSRERWQTVTVPGTEATALRFRPRFSLDRGVGIGGSISVGF